jgi:hypothetical protein
MAPLQLDAAILARVLENVLLIVGLGLLSGGLGGVIGFVHRWYARSRVPEGLAVLIGLSGVALSIQSREALGSVITGTPAGVETLEPAVIVLNTLILLVSVVTAVVGGRSGDRFGEVLFRRRPGRSVDVSQLVRAGGRVITVTLPEEIEDMEGYDPVDPGVKESLAGESLVFPRGLTVEELRARLVSRVESDYGVGHVDADVEADGTVAYFAVGSRESGLGPTLPPETCAVAVHADPAFAASAGDVVQVYRLGDGPDDDPKTVCTAELRGTAGDVVTLAVDAADAADLDGSTRYRLATLPVEPRTDREFAALLRAAEETMGVVQLAEGSPLVGSVVGAVDVAVVAVRSADGDVDPLPPRSRELRAGESLYVIARPDRLRKLDSAARAVEPDND